MAKSPQHTFTKVHFLLIFWLVAALLFGLKLLFPSIAGKELEEVKEIIVRTVRHEAAPRVPADSVEAAAMHTDSIFRYHRQTFKPGATAKVRPLTRTMVYREVFPDTNQVHLNTALRLGAPECADRAAATAAHDRYVFVGESPYYDMERLTFSVPYMVPRGAAMLEEIGRNFLDSLASKGIPMHKMVVTSVLRTQADVQRLRRHNGNASEQSCHLFGTTVDIAYNKYVRVQDPDLPQQPETYGGTLKAVLAEVLDDLRRRGTIYVKYEYRQACFHITCR